VERQKYERFPKALTTQKDSQWNQHQNGHARDVVDDVRMKTVGTGSGHDRNDSREQSERDPTNQMTDLRNCMAQSLVVLLTAWI